MNAHVRQESEVPQPIHDESRIHEPAHDLCVAIQGVGSRVQRLES